MGLKFSHLTRTDRYKIEALLNTGHPVKEIAAEIHRRRQRGLRNPQKRLY